MVRVPKNSHPNSKVSKQLHLRQSTDLTLDINIMDHHQSWHLGALYPLLRQCSQNLGSMGDSHLQQGRTLDTPLPLLQAITLHHLQSHQSIMSSLTLSASMFHNYSAESPCQRLPWRMLNHHTMALNTVSRPNSR